MALWPGPQRGGTGGVDPGGAEHGQEEYTRLRQEIRAGPVVYGDETGWRQDGRNGCLWSFSAPKVRCFLHWPGRSKRVVVEVLGDEFEGVLVSGFYGACNVYQGPHRRRRPTLGRGRGQALLRDIRQLKEQHPQDLAPARWAHAVREVYDHAQAYPGPSPNLPETVQRARRVERQQRCRQWLWSICKPYLGGDAPMRALCRRVERFLPELFTFAAEPRAGADNNADNNAAKRSLRPPVVSRKINGGARSERGSETKSIPASLFGAWRLQERNPYQALQSILSKPHLAPV